MQKKKKDKSKQKETTTTTAATTKNVGSSYSRALLGKKKNAPKIQAKSLKMPPRGLISQSSSRP